MTDISLLVTSCNAIVPVPRCEMLLLGAMQDVFVKNGALKSVLIFLVRFGNTFWGGAQWVQYAKLIGIQ